MMIARKKIAEGYCGMMPFYVNSKIADIVYRGEGIGSIVLWCKIM